MAKKRRAANGKSELDIGVSFGGVSIGSDTASIGVKLPREVVPLTRADEVFVGHRLTGEIIRGRAGDQRDDRIRSLRSRGCGR